MLGAYQSVEERHAAQEALGRSRDPELDVVVQLRCWMELAGLAVHCQAAVREAVTTGGCVRAVPVTLPAHAPRQGLSNGGHAPAVHPAVAYQQASDWIRWAVAQAGGDSSPARSSGRERA